MLRSVTFLSIAATLSIVATLPGCLTKFCSEIGCASSFHVNFTGATGKPGSYQVDVVADGVPSTCQVVLPWTCETQLTCSAAELPWKWMLSGCALGPDRESVGGIMFRDQLPQTVDVIVRRDDVVVGQGSARPVYAESRPNGPDCEPVCRSAPLLEIPIAP
jgi:hypothetical protein